MSFAPLEELQADDLNAILDRLTALESYTAVDDIQVTSGTTTSTTYTATLTGGTACGIAFVAPPSGKVMIYNNCNILNSGAGNQTWCTIRVRVGGTIGSGSDAPDQPGNFDDDAIQHPGQSDCRAGTSRLWTGLTPGNTYNVRQEFRVAAGTGTYSQKSLIVKGVQ